MSKPFVTTENDLWIAEDGTYGSDQLIVVNTSNWTDKDFQKLDDASDSEKQATALKINQERNPQ